jgi:alpha-tubulin suppressor-like RCC1 family protein
VTQCFGAGDKGELGDGKGMDSKTPVAVTGVADGIFMQPSLAALAAGGEHACATLRDATAKETGTVCWGDDQYGQLGDGNVGVQANAPVAVKMLSTTVASLTLGRSHSCALDASGVSCWGFNGHYQTGYVTSSAPQPLPYLIPSLTGVTQIAAGADHTCALTNAKHVMCWGSNAFGQCGVALIGDVKTPTDVGIDDVEAVYTGANHTCVLRAAGRVTCFGDNSRGQLGNGQTSSSSTPGTLVDVVTFP